MMYAKIFVSSTDFHCLRTNWEQFYAVGNLDHCPEGCIEFRIMNEKPELKENEVIGYHCQVVDNVLQRTYVAVDKDESLKPMWNFPRTFSKLKCVEALMDEGVWTEVKKWIEDNGLYDLYLAAQEFSEDNKHFVIGKTQLQQKLGWDDDKIESVLSKCIAN